MSCLCAGPSHLQSSLNHPKKSSESDLQLDIVLWMEHFACQNTSHPIAFKQGYWLKFQNISTSVNAFGFDLNSWVGIGFLGTLFSPFFPCIFILLSHLVIVCCCLPFSTLYNVATLHTVSTLHKPSEINADAQQRRRVITTFSSLLLSHRHRRKRTPVSICCFAKHVCSQCHPPSRALC